MRARSVESAVRRGEAAGEAGAGAELVASAALDLSVRDFTGPIAQLQVRKKAGREAEPLLLPLAPAKEEAAAAGGAGASVMSRLSSFFGGGGGSGGGGAGGAAPEPEELHADGRPVVNVFSLASGHVYERFLKIMMLAATRASPAAHLHFYLVENFLSPAFKESALFLAASLGCDVSFVSYKWPNWLRQQTEKQRIVWGNKVLFLDVLFPLNVTKVIYIDADQIVRSDLLELWRHDLQGAVYGFTPFCTSRKETLGYQFWRSGYWAEHLKEKSYHISALFLVDLRRFRLTAAGDTLRGIYDQLSRDPNSLSNLDQDLPNYAQTIIPIHSLPQEWLYCESWCDDASKAAAKTIDLCNNPRFKEPKASSARGKACARAREGARAGRRARACVRTRAHRACFGLPPASRPSAPLPPAQLDMAKRIINGPLFPKSWVEMDHEVESIEAARRGLPPPPAPTPVPLRSMPTPTPEPPTPTPRKKAAAAPKAKAKPKAAPTKASARTKAADEEEREF